MCDDDSKAKRKLLKITTFSRKYQQVYLENVTHILNYVYNNVNDKRDELIILFVVHFILRTFIK